MNSTFPQSSSSRLVSFTSPGSFAAEQYQGLRLTIERLSKTQGPQVIAITSPAAGEGKTLTSVNLAGALARESDSRVLLIDADLRRPSVAATLGLATSPGLSDVLGSEDLEKPLQGFELRQLLPILVLGELALAHSRLLRQRALRQAGRLPPQHRDRDDGSELVLGEGSDAVA